ncbi:CorA family divalent cation transporter [Nguyenibacter sp. L1]|uniref:CorA family divalent cation transporter n=1 Tax=Nguyenibacter sp. L1 TaxID=3049350 RepID=UPI002B4A078D|nr:CorA family divalent cation transporter [Nguyenibacter sp. L1]WRH89907.1 CorA family divalent cation transporter [Nguyenibacter sp. L1]
MIAQTERPLADPSLTDAADGLVWAVACAPGHRPVPLSSRQAAQYLGALPAFDPARADKGADKDADKETDGGKAERDGSWVWLHYDVVHTASRARVEAIACLPEEARATLAGTERGVRLEADGDAVYGALPGFDESMSDDDTNVSAWRFAALPGLLVTTRRHPVPALGAAYRWLQHDDTPRTPAEVVDFTLLEFADSVRRTLAMLDDQLDRAEDLLLTLDQHTDFGRISGLIGKVRRRSTELRRVTTPVDRIFHSEDLELPEWAEDDIRDRSQRQIHAALDDLMALQDRARALQDELASGQAEETNRRLYTVSIVTTLMLPATFVTGFFGMNTGGMFLASGAFGTVEAGFVCALFMGITWLLLKFAKLL